jgi:hypothetical protein
VANYICPHKNANTIIRNLSNLYVLLGKRSDKDEVGPDWTTVLPADGKLAADMKEYGRCPLAMVLVSPTKSGHFIVEWVESFLRGHDLGARAIDYVEGELHAVGIPMDISGASEYWIPILREKYGTVEAMKQYYTEQVGIDWKQLRTCGYYDNMFYILDEEKIPKKLKRE